MTDKEVPSQTQLWEEDLNDSLFGNTKTEEPETETPDDEEE